MRNPLVSLSKILVKQPGPKTDFKPMNILSQLLSEIQRSFSGLLTICLKLTLVQNLSLSRQRRFIGKPGSRKGINIANIYRYIILRYLTAPTPFEAVFW